jgi:5'-3' exoribonuclease 1
MGVPGLFPFIKETYTGAITNFTPDEPGRSWEFDYVYLDSNPFLHDAVRFIFNLGENHRIKDQYAPLTYAEKELKVFELFFDKIVEVLSIASPQKVLYIALDGCAPRAKMNQQRERRFGSGLKRHEDEETRGVEIVDTSMITPGTEFMHRLSQYMFWRLRIFTEALKSDIEIIYDSPSSPGEGEHKIMDYIRSLPEKERMDATHCMFGPDGDLLFLTLSAHVKKIHLLREDKQPNKQEYYDLVNSSAIAEGLVDLMNQRHLLNNHSRTLFDVSNDFTLIGFFVGNDFLPKIKMFHRLKDGLNKLIGVYITLTKQGHTLTHNININIEGFSRFVFLLSNSEEKYLAHQATVIVPEDKFLDHTLLKHATLGQRNDGSKFVSRIDMSGYRQSYYNKAGIDGKNGDREYENSILQMCKDYFKNLVWVYKYYVEKLPSWEESYKWHYPPLMFDLARYLNNLRKFSINNSAVKEVTTFDLSTPSLPFEQLLSVLSPYSYKILPKELWYLMTDKSSLFNEKGYYPESFEVDCEGKLKDHQCITLLPFVDSQVIRSEYEAFNSKSKKKWHRNEFSTPKVFKYQKTGFLSKYKGPYGTIEKCKVRVF